MSVCGPEVLFETCVAMKFVDDDDDDVVNSVMYRSYHFSFLSYFVVCFCACFLFTVMCALDICS